MPELALAPPSPSGIHQAPPAPTRTLNQPGISNWDTAGQAGIQQPPPSGMSQVRQRPTHTQSWGGCARGAGSPGTQRGGVRHAPAQPHSPDWSRLLRRRRSAGTAAGPHGAPRPGITPSTPRPGQPLPPARCHQCSHIWAGWVCRGSLPLATFGLPLGTGNQPSGSARPDRQELSGSAEHS